MEAKIYNKDGKEAGMVKLPESVFGLSWNADLVHQVMVSLHANLRQPVADTKGRGEVSGGGKKPWRQKGTGRARHGSTRSPIWRTGGVTHGPLTEKNYKKKINRKMRTKALLTVLSQKFRDGEILFVDELHFAEPKTKEALQTLKSFSSVPGFGDLVTKKRNSAMLAFADGSENEYKSFRNLGNIELEEVKNLNVLDILTHKYLIITQPEKSIEFMESKVR